MEKIDELKEELKKAILESDEYKEYKSLEAQIKKNPDLKRAVDELRRQNFEMQYGDTESDMLRASEELNQRFKDIREQDPVNRYLSAEICLCRMIQDICLSVVETVDFDMDFLY